MAERNPYAPPRAPLIEVSLPAAFAAGDWAPGQLRVLGALALGCLFGVLALLAQGIWAALHPQHPALPWAYLLGLLLALLWGYLLLRLKGLLGDRFAARGLGWPVGVQLFAGLLLSGLAALGEAPALAHPGALELGYFALCVALGLSQAWFALGLRRIRQAWTALRLFAFLLFAGGILCASVVLLVPALLLGMLACLALARVFFAAAAELQGAPGRSGERPGRVSLSG